MPLRIKLSSLMVEDQDRALQFYTKTLGFVKKHEIPVGGGYRWITVTSPEGHPDAEPTLEPTSTPAAKTFQEAMFKQGIPLNAFEVGDIDAEHARLRAAGVVFTTEPTQAGPVKIAVFSDTVGNLIQIYQPPA